MSQLLTLPLALALVGPNGGSLPGELPPLSALRAPLALRNHGPGSTGGGSSVLSGEALKEGAFAVSWRSEWTDFERVSRAGAEANALRAWGESTPPKAVAAPRSIWARGRGAGTLLLGLLGGSALLASSLTSAASGRDVSVGEASEARWSLGAHNDDRACVEVEVECRDAHAKARGYSLLVLQRRVPRDVPRRPRALSPGPRRDTGRARLRGATSLRSDERPSEESA